MENYGTDIPNVWEAIQQIAQLMNHEIGFGPARSKVEAVQAANPDVTDWQAQASFFFRERTIQPGELRNAIASSGTPATIALNQANLSEFPQPASDESNLILIDSELFTYTTVTADTQGVLLSGIGRGQNGSVAVTHASDSEVYFVDYFTSGEHGQTLVTIESRQPDFVNLYNDINVSYGDNIHNVKDEASIAVHGKRTLNLTVGKTLLSELDLFWAQKIANGYLKRLKDLKERLQLRLAFSPDLKAGQLIVVHQEKGLKLPHKAFTCVEATHEIPAWQTTAKVIEI